MADGPARHTDLDPLDDEWEKFQANGCPDWWLLAKYVGQAARSFPYQPFRGMSTAGGVTELDGRATDGLRAEQASSSVELQQCASHSSNEQHQQVLTAARAHSMQPSCHTGKEPAAGAGAPAASTTAGQGGLPDALPTLPCRAESGTTAAAAAPATCGLKGIFGCNGGCTPTCTASHTADQMG